MGGVGLKGKQWAPPPRPRPRWECPAVSVPGSLDGFFGQVIAFFPQSMSQIVIKFSVSAEQ